MCKSNGIKRNECVAFFNICPKLVNWGFPPSCLAFFFLTMIMFVKKERGRKIDKNIKTTFLCRGPLAFATRGPLLPLSQQNHCTVALDNVDLKINLLKTSNFMVTLCGGHRHLDDM